MSRILCAWVCLLALSAYADEDDSQRVFNAVRASVVSVRVFDANNQLESQGSGVAVSGSRVVTNCHVVEEAPSIMVIQEGGKPMPAKVSRRDHNRDLCILDVPGLSSRPVSFREADVEVGTRLYSIGNPLGFGLAVGSGLLTAYPGEGAARQLVITAPTSPGSSGGGVFDERGMLVGITTSAFFFGQNLGVAVAARWVKELNAHGEQVTARSDETKPDPNWLAEAEKLTSAGDWSQLGAFAQRWLNEYPTSVQALQTLALALVKQGKGQAARDLLIDPIRGDQTKRKVRGSLVMAYTATRELAAAEELAKAVLKDEPSNSNIWAFLSEIQLYAGKTDAAKDSLRRTLRLDPSQRYSLLELANLEYRAANYDEAIKMNRLLLQLYPDEIAARRNLAAALAAKGLGDEARDTLVGTREAKAGSAEIWGYLANQEMKNGRHHEAEKAFRKAIEVDPQYAPGWSNLGNLLVATNRFEEGERAFREALRLKPDLGPAARNLGIIFLRRKQYSEALPLLIRASELEPNAIEVWHALGVLYKELRDWPNVGRAYAQATRIDEKSASDWASLGEAQMRLGRMAESRVALERALRLDPLNALALQATASFYGSSGDHAKALAITERELKINPADFTAWSNKGYALLKLGRINEAVEALQTAISLVPDNVPALINMGEAYLAQKELARAIVSLERANKLSPGASDTQLFLGRAYLASGQPQIARQYIEPLLTKYPGNVEAAYTATELYVLTGDEQNARRLHDHLKLLSIDRAKQVSKWSRTLSRNSQILPD